MTEETPDSAPPPDDLTADEAAADGMPRVVFEHSFFTKLEDVCFRISEQTGEAVMNVRFAKNEISLPLKGIKKELQLAADSADAQMLDQCAEALQYVRGLRLGDPLPREMITREASWELSERHVKIAYQRVAVQLVNWMTGGDQVISDPDELLQLADDPNIKKSINKAFGEAAVKLGLGLDRKEEVIGFVQQLAQELAYIEALRERLRHIEEMDNKIQALRRLYGRERSVMEVADQVARLCERALQEFKDTFLEVDAQTGEILAVLRNLNSQVEYIRDKRDELHAKLMAWDETLTEWDKVQIKMGQDKPELFRRTYHFLAPRYMMVNEWVLMTKPRPAGEGTSLLGKDGKPKKPVHVMRW
ncbi:MAG TPA: hypothetical protein VM661_07340 [Candidatus Sulfotelmatobacter sp.]|jgi:hypothetical protein|nr:hypothetical protein [Candidatus Sulfotelmatobacter sp.]